MSERAPKSEYPIGLCRASRAVTFAKELKALSASPTVLEGMPNSTRSDENREVFQKLLERDFSPFDPTNDRNSSAQQAATIPTVLSCLERVLYGHTGRAEIADIAGDDGCTMMQGRGGDHQIGTGMPDFG